MSKRLKAALLAICLLAGTPAVYANETVETVKPAPAANYWTRASDLVMHALGFLGVHYRYGGRSPDTGFDCSGLVGYVFNQLGMILPRDAREMSQVGERITPQELQPGDLVFFNTRRRPFSHVGIYVGDHRFIHAPGKGRGVEVVDMTDRYWQHRYNGARRIPL